MNTQNIINYIKKYFIECGTRDIRPFIVLTVLSIFLGSSNVLLIIFAFIFANGLFGYLSFNNSRISYLMVPVSCTERTVANAILFYLYFNIVLIICVSIGSLINYTAIHLVLKNFDDVSGHTWAFPFTLGTIIKLLTWESVCMFGFIYFRRNAMIRTALSVMVAVIVICIIASVTGSIIVKNSDLELRHVVANNSYKAINGSLLTNTWKYIFGTILIVFFNFMSWLRLRETEA